MPNNPLTQQELYDYGILRILTPPTPAGTVPSAPYFPPGYFLVPPHDVDGIVAWRKFHAGYITEGLIDPDRLGTGSLGFGDLYLADDGTWKIVSGLLPPGGTTGQILAKIDGVDYNTEWIDNYTSSVKHEVKLGENMSKGTPVYVSGTTGGSGTNMIVSKASNATEMTSSKTMGLIATGGVTNDFVFVVTEGLLAGLDTSTAIAGDPVWLGPNGTLLFGLANKPVAPAHMVALGVVTRVSTNNGEIFVKVQNGFEIEELHDVLITSKANNDLLVYESATSLWKNKTISSIFGGTPLVTTPTLAQVTTAGNTTTNAITVSQLFTNTVGSYGNTSITGFHIGLTNTLGFTGGITLSSDGALRNLSGNRRYLFYTDGNTQVGFMGSSKITSWNSALRFGTSFGTDDWMTLFTNGNVAIGTTTDAGFKLDVNGTLRTVNHAYLATSSGNVGIGTLSPTDTNSYGKALDIQSNAGAAAYFRDSDDTSKYFLSGFAGQTTNHGIIGTWGTDTLLRVFTSGNERMRIDSFGNVGIGTTAPGYKLEVAGTFRSSGAAYASGGLGVNLTGGLTSDFDVNGFAKVRLDLQVDRRIYVNDFLYIGTSTFSGYKLDVNGTARISGNTTVVGQVTATNGSDTTNLTSAGINMNRFYCYIVPLSNNSQTLFFGDVTKGVQDWAAISLKATNVELAANVGINTASPTVPLDVNGAARIQGNMNAQTYSVNGTAGWTGTITIPTNPPGQQNIAVNSGIITNVF